MTSSPVRAVPTPSACVSGTDYVSTVDGGSTYVAFKNSGVTCDFEISSSSVDYLVVGGGGGGGRTHAGGGGAGGMLTGTASVDVCSALTVTVGAGGLGNLNAAYPAFRGGANGGNSELVLIASGIGLTLTAVGGGGGISGGDTALTGGSGGGGLNSSGLGTPGQGNNGSLGQSATAFGGFVRAYWSGGGGGAGSAGTQGTTSGGDGGAGAAWLSGTFTAAVATALGLDASLVSGGNVYFAGGGGGGGTSGSFVPTRLEGGLGGLGGGARGGAGAGATNPDVDVAGADAVPGSGGGGGGGGLTDNGGSNPGFSQGGDGGSGIVIVKFTAGEPCPTPGGGSSERNYSLLDPEALPDTR